MRVGPSTPTVPVANAALMYRTVREYGAYPIDVERIQARRAALHQSGALKLRRLAAELPLSALVLETDAPDIPPHWLYVTAGQRAAGQPRQPNEPAELPRIGAVVAGLRGMAVDELAAATGLNAQEALGRGI